MKIKRYKKAQRILGFFQNNFDIRQPYTVLIDGPFCRAALENKVVIKEQVPKYLGEQTKLVTTQCIILEVEKLSKISHKLYGAWLVVKQFAVHKCGHEGRPIPAMSCVRSMIRYTNPAKYIVATQDDGVREYIHERVKGTPILYLYNAAPTLEKPSEKSQKAAAKTSTLTLSTHEAVTLQTLKRQHLGEDQQEPPKKKKKKAKGPNPMSCRKSKKVKEPAPQPKEDGKRKRTRSRKKKSAVCPSDDQLEKLFNS